MTTKIHLAAFTIAQTSRFAFPLVSFAVLTPSGETLALIRRSLFSRLGRNRWKVMTAGGRSMIAEAIMPSPGAAKGVVPKKGIGIAF